MWDTVTFKGLACVLAIGLLMIMGPQVQITRREGITSRKVEQIKANTGDEEPVLAIARICDVCMARHIEAWQIRAMALALVITNTNRNE